LRDLLEDGMPLLKVDKDKFTSSDYFAGHEVTAAGSKGTAPFNMLDIATLIQILEDAAMIDSSSLTMLNMWDGRERVQVSFKNTFEINDLLRAIIRDVLVMSGYNKLVSYRPEVALGTLRFDYDSSRYWTLQTPAGRPIMIILHKDAHVMNVLDHPRVHGQAFDCLIDAMGFYGLLHMLCLTTTVEEFRFHWLPHSDE
jgi:hypothetical protein